MWKFRFAALLQIRRRAERACQLELARALAHERELLAAIADNDVRIAHEYRVWGKRGALISVAREATFESRISAFGVQREVLALRLTDAAQSVVTAGHQLEIASRARASIERLETRARTEHEARLALGETLALEESNVARSNAVRRGQPR